jgi:hypothetical protein
MSRIQTDMMRLLDRLEDRLRQSLRLLGAITEDDNETPEGDDDGQEFERDDEQ